MCPSAAIILLDQVGKNLKGAGDGFQKTMADAGDTLGGVPLIGGGIRAPFDAGGGSVAGLELESAELFRLDNPYWHDNPAVFARDYVQSVTAWGGPLLLRAFAREGEARAAGLLADFLGELQERIANAPDRYRWDYVEALVICRKARDAEQANG